MVCEGDRHAHASALHVLLSTSFMGASASDQGIDVLLNIATQTMHC
jgi:hypothetical protein